MSKTKTFRTPITVHDGKKYCPPGSEITMDVADADRFIEAHGEYGGANVPADPAKTETLNDIDKKSLGELNTFAELNGGHGKNAPSLNKRVEAETGDKRDVEQLEPLPDDDDLEKMSKAALIALAADRQVEIEDSATKAEIIAALKK